MQETRYHREHVGSSDVVRRDACGADPAAAGAAARPCGFRGAEKPRRGQRQDGTGRSWQRTARPRRKRWRKGARQRATHAATEERRGSITRRWNSGRARKAPRHRRRCAAARQDGRRHSLQKKKTQDAQRQNESSPNSAQRRPDTSSTQQRPSAARPKVEQHSGSKQGSDVETTGSVGITAEKRTTIRETITRESVRTPIRDVNLSVNVGIEAPRTIEPPASLPARVIEIVPAISAVPLLHPRRRADRHRRAGRRTRSSTSSRLELQQVLLPEGRSGSSLCRPAASLPAAGRPRNPKA